MNLTNTQLKMLRATAKRAIDAESRSSLAVSKLVWETKHAQVRGHPDTSAWAHWGYPSWKDYLRAELQMSIRTALEHIRVWEVFGIKLKGMWSTRKALPFTKMALLSMMALNAKDVDSLLDSCRQKSRFEIRAMLRSRSRGARDPAELVTTSLTFNQDGFSEYLGYISTTRLASGPVSRGEAVLVAMRYFVEHAPEVTGVTPQTSPQRTAKRAKKTTGGPTRSKNNRTTRSGKRNKKEKK